MIKVFLAGLLVLVAQSSLANTDALSLLTSAVRPLGILANEPGSQLSVLEGRWENPRFSYDKKCKLLIHATEGNLYISPSSSIYDDIVKPDVYGLSFKANNVVSLIDYEVFQDTISLENSDTVVLTRKQTRDYYSRYSTRYLKLVISNEKIVGFELEDPSGAGYRQATCILN